MSDGGAFIEVSSSPLLVSPVVVTNAIIKSGVLLTVRYRAKNVHDWSIYSDTSTILAATVPSAPLQLISTIGAMKNYVTLSWSSPVSSGGTNVLISQYEIQI
jgi:hypothetical protein